MNRLICRQLYPARHVDDGEPHGLRRDATRWPGACGDLPATSTQRSRFCERPSRVGVNHIDTTDFYGPHVTNQIIKQALHPYPTIW